MTVADLKKLFGAAVKTKRSELGISQEELADRAGLHRTYVSDIERGARNLSLESIEKLAGALKLSVSYLFEKASTGGTDQPIEILLVEDMAADIELTLHAFKKARITNPVHLIRDGAEALDFLFATGRHAGRKGLPLPGVVLLDLFLPKVDGIEVLRQMKADERTAHIPVIVLTASQYDAHADMCRALGVETYITKPVDFRNFSAVTPALRLNWQLTRPL